MDKESEDHSGRNSEKTGAEVQRSKDQKRITHNEVEKRRKNKMKHFISSIGQMLPTQGVPGVDRQSTLEVMEGGAKYIKQLQKDYEQLLTEKGDPVLVDELRKLRDLEVQLTNERNELAAIIRAKGISMQASNSQWKGGSKKSDSSISNTSIKDADREKDSKSGTNNGKKKSYRRQNTVSAQLEQKARRMEQQQKQQQMLSQLLSQFDSVILPGQRDLNSTSSLPLPVSRPSAGITQGQILNNTGGQLQLSTAVAGICTQDMSSKPGRSVTTGVQNDPVSAQTSRSAGPVVLQTVICTSSLASWGVVMQSEGISSTPVTATVMSSAKPQNMPIMSAKQQPTLQSSLAMISLNSTVGQTEYSTASQPGAGQKTSGTAVQTANSLVPVQTSHTPQVGSVFIMNENGVLVPYDPSTGMASEHAAAGSHATPVPQTGVPVADRQQQVLTNRNDFQKSANCIPTPSTQSSITVSHPQVSLLTGVNSQAAGVISLLSSQLSTQSVVPSLTIQPGSHGGNVLGQQLQQSMTVSVAGVMAGAGTATSTTSSQASQTVSAAVPALQTLNNNIILPTNQGGLTFNAAPSVPQHLPSAIVLPSCDVIPVTPSPQSGGAGQASNVIAASSKPNSASTTPGHIQLPLQVVSSSCGSGQAICVTVTSTINSRPCLPTTTQTSHSCQPVKAAVTSQLCDVQNTARAKTPASKKTAVKTATTSTSEAPTTGCASVAVSSGGDSSGNKPVVYMVQSNGQVSNVPLTFQMLNSAPNSNTPLILISPVSAKTQQASSASVSKKPRKGSSQRAIFPKPKPKDPAGNLPASKTSVSKSSASAESSKTRSSVATSKNACVKPSAATEQSSKGKAVHCEKTPDILAEAALSIWPGKESNQPLRYSPTNDDSPLMIDDRDNDNEENRQKGVLPAKKSTSVMESSAVVTDLNETELLLPDPAVASSSQNISRSVQQLQTSCVTATQQETSQGMWERQEEEEQKRLQLQKEAQHDQLMRHLECGLMMTSSDSSVQASTSSTSSQASTLSPSTSTSVSVIGPSMPASVSLGSISSTLTTSSLEMVPSTTGPLDNMSEAVRHTTTVASTVVAAENDVTAALPAKKMKKKAQVKRKVPETASVAAVARGPPSSKKRKKNTKGTENSSTVSCNLREVDQKQIQQQQEEQQHSPNNSQPVQLSEQYPSLFMSDGCQKICSETSFPENIEFSKNEISIILEQIETGSVNQITGTLGNKDGVSPEKEDKRIASSSPEPKQRKLERALDAGMDNLQQQQEQQSSSDTVTPSSQTSGLEFQSNSPAKGRKLGDLERTKSSTSVPSVSISVPLGLSQSETASVSADRLGTSLTVSAHKQFSESLHTPKKNNKNSQDSEKLGESCIESHDMFISSRKTVPVTTISSKHSDGIGNADSVVSILSTPIFDSLDYPAPVVSSQLMPSASAMSESRVKSTVNSLFPEIRPGQLSSIVTVENSRSLHKVTSGQISSLHMQPHMNTLHHLPQPVLSIDDKANRSGTVLDSQQKLAVSDVEAAPKQQMPYQRPFQQLSSPQQSLFQHQTVSTNSRQFQLHQFLPSSSHAPPTLPLPVPSQIQTHSQKHSLSSIAQVVSQPYSINVYHDQGPVHTMSFHQTGSSLPSASTDFSPFSTHCRTSQDKLGKNSGLLLNSSSPSMNTNQLDSNTQSASHNIMKYPPQSKICGANANSSKSKSRTGNGIYSADNFVQPSQQQNSRNQLPQPVFGGNRSGANEVSSAAFNFTSIGMNLTSTQTSGSKPDTGIMSSMNTPFSFSLSSLSQTSVSKSSLPYQQAGTTFDLFSSKQSCQSNCSISMLLPELNNQPPIQQQGVNSVSIPPLSSHSFGGSLELGNSSSSAANTSTTNPVNKLSVGSIKQNLFYEGIRVNDNRTSQKNFPEITSQQSSVQCLDNMPLVGHSLQIGSHSSKPSVYFPGSSFPSGSLNTPPLHHPPLPTANSSLIPRGYDHSFNESQIPNGGLLTNPSFDPLRTSFKPNQNQTGYELTLNSNPRRSGSQSQLITKDGTTTSAANSMGGILPHSQSCSIGLSQNLAISTHTTSQRSAPSQNSGNTHAPPQSPNQSRSSKRKQASSTQSKKKGCSSNEETTTQNIFDVSQNVKSMFSLQTMSPTPSRNTQNDGPSFLANNIFGASSHPTSSPSNKHTTDLGPPYSIFAPPCSQNGSGINFDGGFAMQNMTGSQSSGPATSHTVTVTPHMSSFNMGNILPDVTAGTGDTGLNISPIKFSHSSNSILPSPQTGMEPSGLQHTHQGSALYHNRPHPSQPHLLSNPVTLNHFWGHGHHSFDARPWF